MTANGSEIVPLEGHPFVVSVTINNRHACGGFIYSGYFVVTTATCVFGYLSANKPRFNVIYNFGLKIASRQTI